MATASISDEFPDLPSFWTNSNSIDLVNGAEMGYSSSDFSSARTSISSEAPRIYNGYAHASKMGTPEESGFGYHLPSPLEDDVFFDPGVVDKEKRREQNRVAQRAFRERKESKLKQLEKRITELKTEHRTLERKYENLRTAHVRLQSGLRILLDAGGTFDNEDTDSSGTADDSRPL